MSYQCNDAKSGGEDAFGAEALDLRWGLEIVVEGLENVDAEDVAGNADSLGASCEPGHIIALCGVAMYLSGNEGRIVEELVGCFFGDRLLGGKQRALLICPDLEGGFFHIGVGCHLSGLGG